MADARTAGPIGGLTWPGFEPGDVFGTRDLRDLQFARQQLVRRHLRYLHGASVVCGLQVVADPAPAQPWRIRVCPGYGIGPCGDELTLSAALQFDLADTAAAHQTLAGRRGGIVVVGLRPDVELRGGMRETAAGGCVCTTPERHAARLADRTRVVVLDARLIPARPDGDLCQGELPCPPCPVVCDLPIARVRLPASVKQALTDAAIVRIL
jgi:hypothetical protein